MRETVRDLQGRALVTLPRALLVLTILLLLGLATFTWLSTNPPPSAGPPQQPETLATAPAVPTPPAPLDVEGKSNGHDEAGAKSATAAESPLRAPEAATDQTAVERAAPPTAASTATEEEATTGEIPPPQVASSKATQEEEETPAPLAAALAAAATNEAQADWELALLDYQQAMAIDPSSLAAREGIERARRAIAKQKFQAAMSDGLTALSKGEYATALEAFQAARPFNPESAELADALAQAQAGLRRARLARLERRGRELEAAERWQDAFDVYQQALAIDASLVFARSARERTRQLAETQVQLEYFLQQPDRLYSRNAREAAQRFLEAHRALAASGNRLKQSLGILEERLRQAATPLPVELRSDGETAVAVYHVGRLGQFETYRLELLPGDYTIVGSRPGYRDVRHVLHVRPQTSPPVVKVVCTERI